MAKRFHAILRGDPETIDQLIRHDRGWPLRCVLIILVGAGIYGSTVGLWRSPLQAGFTAIKFPLLVFLTGGGNALLNGILAQLIGSGLSFRQTTSALLTSLAVASCLLAAFATVTLFVLANAPPLLAKNAIIGHSVILVVHIFFIAYAGTLANSILLRFLKSVTTATVARRTLLGWLAGNFLLGSQLAWVLRPFVGSPQLAVEFLRPDPLRGNFYEAVGRALRHLFF